MAARLEPDADVGARGAVLALGQRRRGRAVGDAARRGYAYGAWLSSSGRRCGRRRRRRGRRRRGTRGRGRPRCGARRSTRRRSSSPQSRPRPARIIGTRCLLEPRSSATSSVPVRMSTLLSSVSMRWSSSWTASALVDAEPAEHDERGVRVGVRVDLALREAEAGAERDRPRGATEARAGRRAGRPSDAERMRVTRRARARARATSRNAVAGASENCGPRASRRQARAAAIFSAARVASAMIVTCGLTPSDVGTAAPSTT